MKRKRGQSSIRKRGNRENLQKGKEGTRGKAFSQRTPRKKSEIGHHIRVSAASQKRSGQVVKGADKKSIKEGGQNKKKSLCGKGTESTSHGD